MFLTRLGFASKMVITGDITQIDLANPKHSGLIHAIKVLKNENKISFCHFFINKASTSKPCSISRRAATDESTPPESPTMTLRGVFK
jgi:predicted ribonuclease YlaK